MARPLKRGGGKALTAWSLVDELFLQLPLVIFGINSQHRMDVVVVWHMGIMVCHDTEKTLFSLSFYRSVTMCTANYTKTTVQIFCIFYFGIFGAFH